MKKTLLLTIMAIALASNACRAQAQEPVEDDDTKYATELFKPGEAVPDFTLCTPDGTSITLSDYRGRYVVLDFWASWCPDCVKDAPNIVRMHSIYGSRGIEFIGVSGDDDKDNWTAAIEKFGIEYTQVSELKKWKETEIAKTFRVKWIPSIYLINPEGKVVVSTVMSEKVEAELSKISPVCEIPSPKQ